MDLFFLYMDVQKIIWINFLSEQIYNFICSKEIDKYLPDFNWLQWITLNSHRTLQGFVFDLTINY